MTRVEHNVIIQAPVERVFNYAADYQKWSDFINILMETPPKSNKKVE